MNLAEYKNQVDPVANPIVQVEESEIKRFGKYTDKYGDEYESIKIDGYGHTYDLHIKSGLIWAEMSNGKRRQTVFHLRFKAK